MTVQDFPDEAATALSGELELVQRGYQPLKMGPDQRLGFLPWEFISFSLPYRKQTTEHWVRQNGNYRLSITAGEVIQPDGSTARMLPYGKYARAALLWMCTQARLSGDRTLVLGSSYSAFLDQLGIGARSATASRGGQRKRAIDDTLAQLRALFAASISVSVIDHESPTATGVFEVGYRLSHKSALWFDHRQPTNMESLLPSTVTLSEGLMESITRSRVIDLQGWRNVQAGSKSPLALDVYVWLCSRLFSLPRKSYVSWTQLHAQFGSNDALSSFKQSFRKALTIALAEYPAARIQEIGGDARSGGFHGFLLMKSPPAIAPRVEAQYLTPAGDGEAGHGHA